MLYVDRDRKESIFDNIDTWHGALVKSFVFTTFCFGQYILFVLYS